MKWLVALILAFTMVTPAFAGEDPYIAIVGTDSAANTFYVSPKYLQFMFNEYAFPFSLPTSFGSVPSVNQYTRVGTAGTEMFRSQTLNNQPEVCDTTGTVVQDGTITFIDRGLDSAKTPAGNSGFYEWYVRLPKKPSGEIDLVIQCGVLKPNAFATNYYDSVEKCAAETGERVGFGTCVRKEVNPGTNPLVIGALPQITAMVYPGPNNVAFAPFHLTAFRNPGTYNPFNAAGELVNGAAGQVLNGTANTATRILLKSCMDKTVVTKLPVTGQVNALGELETDLDAGDLVYVRIDIPRNNTVDVYCHAQSLKVMGVGETPY
jgi:hypothetical protein